MFRTMCSLRVLCFLFLCLVPTLLVPRQPARADELEQPAKKDGELRLVAYPSLKPLAEAFQRKYGIKVEGMYVGEPPIVRKVSEESDAGIFAVDVFTTSTGPAGSTLNKWALAYNPAGFDKVADLKKTLPADWNQIPLFNNVVGVVYNSELVPHNKAPKSIYDLLKPEFKGKIISRTPWLGSNFLTAILSYDTWFGRDMKKWEDYWRRFKQNVGRYEPEFPTIHTAVGLKEFSLGVFTLTWTSTLYGRSYPALAFSTFKEGGIWWPNMAAIHNKAPHPNAAKLFVNFLVSEEGQKYFVNGGMIPARKDMPARAELKQALEGIKLNSNLQNVLLKELAEREAEWKARVQKIFR